MLRSVLTYAVVSVLAVPASVSAEKRFTGKVANNRFHDNAFDFQIEKYDNWKFGKIDNEDSAKPKLMRCLVSQMTVAYPTDYIGNEDKFTMPVIGVFVDTTGMVLDAYAAELADRKSKRPSRKALTREFTPMGEGDFVERTETSLDGQRAVVLHYRKNYEVQLYYRARDQYKLKEDAILGDLYVVKRDNLAIMLGFICEREIYRTVNEEARKIIMSLDLDPPSDTTQGANPGTPGQ